MNLFKLFGTISVNNDEANQKIDETTGQAEEAGSRVGSALEKLGGIAVKIGAATVAAIGAVATGLGALSKQSLDAYAEYEQLVGGVETLFKDSADVVQKYAENAYKTAGMSANQYMETVTGFSASLLQSLGGDTAKAAEKADMAITDMADNANKMGTSMESIQNAYQGFAKQNYTMLDNLKLGYGGTQEEMKRLLKDAQAISGIEYDISSYADIVDAIHVIQTEMDITGTTSREAASTIQGSVGMMKGAWQNFLTGMADPEQDFDALVENLVDSVVTVADNIAPRLIEIVPRLVDGLLQAVDKIMPYIGPMLDKLLPELLNGAVKLVGKLAKAIPGILKSLSSVIGNALQNVIVSALQMITGSSFEEANEMFNGFAELVLGAFESIQELIQPLIDAFGLLFGKIGETSSLFDFSDAFSVMGSVIDQVWQSVAKPVFDALTGAINWLSLNWATISENMSVLWTTMWDMIYSCWNYIGVPIFDAIEYAIGLVRDAFAERMPEILSFFTQVTDDIQEIWEENLEPCFKAIGDFLNVVLKPIFKSVFEDFILPLVDNVFKSIKLFWENTLKPVFKGIADFLTGVFTGDWEKAFEGIVNIVKGAANGVIAGIEWMINRAIDGINAILAGIEAVANAAGEMLGFDPIHLTLGYLELPRLSKGGVLEKGQVGLLEGDGAEAVVPLEQNKKWISRVSQEMQEQGIGGGSETLGVLKEILELLKAQPDVMLDAIANGLTFNVNNREFGRMVKAVN